MEPPATARTVRVHADRLPRWLAGFTERHGECTVAASDSVVQLRGADGAQAWIEVPFAPLPQCASSAQDPCGPGRVLDHLIAHVSTTRRVGALLVRRGGYGVGIFDGSKLVSSKVGSSYVQGTTKAGGWSQQRYARRRQNQADAAFAEAAEHAARILVPAAGQLDAVFCGGSRDAIAATLTDPRLAVLKELVGPRILDVADPRLKVLAALPQEFLGIDIHLVP